MTPKTYYLRFAQKNKKIYQAILDGRKTVETRAASVRYRNIKNGDIVILWCGPERTPRSAKQVRHFKSVASLLRAYPTTAINPFARSKVELDAMYAKFPGYSDKIKQHGLVAIEFA